MIITTTKGPMDEALLTKKVGDFEDDNEKTSWVEYYDGDELVHRSAHVCIKKGVVMDAIAGEMS